MFTRVATVALADVIAVSLAGETVRVNASDMALALDSADRLVAKHGGVPEFSYWKLGTVEPVVTVAPVVVETPVAPIVVEAPTVIAPVYSSFGTGNQVIDADAKVRIEALHASVNVSGAVVIDASKQLFATGTRMAREGYETQRKREAMHLRAKPIAEVAHALETAVRSEQREDIVVSSREFARSLAVNGKITAQGFALTEQAIKGLTMRLESPALSYLLGLRKRIAVELAKPAGEPDAGAVKADKAKIAEIIAHECERSPDVALKLRTRKGPGDIFAIVSPSFTAADAPEVIGQILRGMPSDAKGTWSYDATSTAWELRASVFTPTPADDQAVGEPFSGYASFAARDNGTAKFRGGGGVELLRCLNASTYVAESKGTERVHRGRAISYDIARMVESATAAISALCNAWGKNRAVTVEVPSGVTLEMAIPGFWRSLLTDRRSELAAVLPGRTEEHVKLLSRVYESERRDHSQIVRADFGQAWTRYIQDQPTSVRRDAETAVGEWLMSSTPVRCDLLESA